ncbi:MAG: hypothetical protein GY795_30295 [Desulfobacterales bacterium]|nr:hypothetical protein [Desulfobacterales bacterium]
MELLHLGHPGITRMLQQYRLCYYWPGGMWSVPLFRCCQTSGISSDRCNSST